MAKGLAQFSTEIKARHVAKASKFSIYFSPPPFMINDVGNFPYVNQDTGLVQLFAESVHFPEFIIETNRVKDDGVGREVPYDKLYPPIACSFICDADMIVKKFFDDWVQGIMKTETGTFRYLENYQIHSMEISQLNENMDETYTVTLYDVYPKLVNDVAMSSSSRDFNRCTVQFVYRKWNSEKL